MTVAELKQYLDTLPQDTVIGVVFRVCSDLEVLQPHDLEFTPDGEATNIFRHPKRYVLRNGRIMEYNEKIWPPNETPQFIPVLILPGN